MKSLNEFLRSYESDPQANRGIHEASIRQIGFYPENGKCNKERRMRFCVCYRVKFFSRPVLNVYGNTDDFFFFIFSYWIRPCSKLY